MAKTIYPVVAGAIPTASLHSFKVTDDSLTVESIDYIPKASGTHSPGEIINHVTIRDEDNFVTITYSDIIGNTLTGITYVEGNADYTFPAGSSVVRSIDKYDLDALAENIAGVPATTTTLGQIIVGDNLTVDSNGRLSGTIAGTLNYNELNNKPAINSVELSGNKTGADLNLVSLEQGKIPTEQLPLATTNSFGAVKIGSGITVNNGVISTEDVIHSYNELTDKPSIESVELSGNKTASDLGLATADELELKQDKLPQTSVAGMILKSTNVAGQVQWSQSGTTTVGWGDITGSISNQSDLQTALNGKVNTLAGKGLSTNDYTDDDKILVSTIDNKVDKVSGKGLSTNDYTTEDKTIVSGVTTALGNKVDKVTGKVLSSNDFTTALKDKLDGIESGANVNVQADWDETDTESDSYILNKPSNVSDFTNDVNYQTDTEVQSAVSTHDASTTAHSDIRGLITAEATARATADSGLQSQIDALEAKGAVTDLVGTHAELLEYDVSKLTENDVIQVLQDETHSNAVGYYKYIGGSQPDCWSFTGSTAETYTKTQADARFALQTTTVNAYPLSSSIVLDADDVNALPYDTTLADIPDDSTHRLVTDTQISSWNGKVDAVTGKGLSTNDYTDTDKEIVDGVTSALNNKVDKDGNKVLSDNNYTTSDKNIVSGVTSALNNKVDKVDNKGLSTEDFTTVLKTKLEGIDMSTKVNINQGLSEAGKYLKVDSNGYVTTGSSSTLSVDWGNIAGTLANQTDLKNALDSKVDKVADYGLSKNDFTDALKTKLDGIESGAQVNVKPNWNATAGTSAEILNKPTIPTAVSELDNDEGYQTASDVATAIAGVTKESLGLGNVDNTADLDKPISTATRTALDGKVDEVEGYGLSKNDFTDTLKAKLDGIESGAEVNVHADWEEDDTESDAYILNKPTIPDITNLVPNTRKVNGQALSADVTIDIPTAVSELTNDSGYQTASDVQTAISGKQDTLTFDDEPTEDSTNPVTSGGVYTALSDKVDVVEGKGLSANDFSDYYEGKLDSIHEGAEVNVQSDWNISDTTSDAYIKNKPSAYMPVSHAVTHTNGADDIQTADATKKGLLSASDWSTFNNKQDELTFDTVPTLDSQNVVNSGVIYSALSGKVDVESGKGLSTNDYTTAEKNKLAGLVSNVQSDWNGTGLSAILNKPTIPDISNLVPDTRTVNGQPLSDDVEISIPTKTSDLTNDSGYLVASDITNKVDKVAGYALSKNDFTDAFKTKLEGIASGAEVNVLESVKVNGTAQTITSKAVNITVPTKTSDLTNDSSFATTSNVTSAVSTHNSATDSHSDIRTSISSETSRAEGRESALQSAIDALASKTDVVDVVGTHAELLAYDTSTLSNNDIIKVLVDETHDDAISYYRWVISTTSSFTYVGSQGPFYTKEEADGYFVPQQRTINGKSLANNITLSASDVSALPSSTTIPSTLAELTGDATHRIVTDTEKSTWNGKQNALTFDSTPTQSSSNPVTSGGIYTALSGKVDKSGTKQLSDENFTSSLKTKLEGIASGAEVNVNADWNATSGDAQILNKPSIPTKVSDLTNDSGFITGVAWGDVSGKPTTFTPSAHNHSASEITSGTLDVARIPSLTKSKISDFPTTMTPTAHVSTHKSGGTDALYSVATPSLTVAGWSSKSQTVSVSGVTTTNTVIVAPAPSSIDEWTGKGVKCTAQGSGTLTFNCTDVPTSAITVNVMVML